MFSMLFLIVPRSLSLFTVLSLPFIPPLLRDLYISCTVELFSLLVCYGQWTGHYWSGEICPMTARVPCEGVTALVNTILGCDVLCVTDHLAQIDKVNSEVRRYCEEQFKITSSSLLNKLPLICHSVQRAVDFGTSGWLTTLPLAHHHFDLSPQQFQDTLYLHYHWQLSFLPLVMGVGGCLACLMLWTVVKGG